MADLVWDNIRPTDAARIVTDRSPYQQGRDEERAAIVAWLRAKAERYGALGRPNRADEDSFVADEIEAGKHLKPRT